MEKTELKEGDLVQIYPTHPKFPGFFLVVTEPKLCGAVGYLLHSREFDAAKYKGRAFLRVAFEEVKYCGKAYWLEEDK